MSDADIARLQVLSDELYAMLREKHPLAIQALNGYTNAKTGKHRLINGVLRKGSDASEADRREVMEGYVPHIDLAIKEFKNPFDATVYCGTNGKHYRDWEVGSIREKKEYLSTSADREVAGVFLRDKENDGKEPLMLEIFIPKGARGIYIGKNTANHKNESEFLLGRGLKYKVLERCRQTLRLEVLQ